MKYFSMFSGIGGFELGIQNSIAASRKVEKTVNNIGYMPNDTSSSTQVGRQSASCIGYSEIDKYAIQIYEKHFKGHRNYGDATRIIPEQLPDFDMLCGGFPCQSFSIAGKRGGFEDTKGIMFFEIARIVSVKRPKLLFLENVKGLLSHDNGRTFGTILSTLSDLGYICEWQVLNSKDFGVPQNRERVFIIGHLGRCGGRQVFPIGCGDEKTYSQRNERVVSGTLSTKNQSGQAQWDASTTLIKGAKIRRLTPTECERLQGFPDGWTDGISDTQRYKCLGNAVTVNVIEAIMRKIIEQTMGGV